MIEKINEWLIKSLGEPDNSIEDHGYEIRPLTVEGRREWWMFHNGVGSGEPLTQWLNEFATLHAQRLAALAVAEATKEIADYKRSNPYKDQNHRLREWFKHRTGLKTDFLQSHMKKIDNMLKDCYPKEFVEWMFKEGIGKNEDGTLFHYVSIQIEGHPFKELKELIFKTLDELFDYWKNLKR